MAGLAAVSANGYGAVTAIFVLGQNMAAKFCLVGHFLSAIFCPTPPKLVLGHNMAAKICPIQFLS